VGQVSGFELGNFWETQRLEHSKNILKCSETLITFKVNIILDFLNIQNVSWETRKTQKTLICNQQVAGSNPIASSRKFKGLR
jgi:hypothetical protein